MTVASADPIDGSGDQLSPIPMDRVVPEDNEQTSPVMCHVILGRPFHTESHGGIMIRAIRRLLVAVITVSLLSWAPVSPARAFASTYQTVNGFDYPAELTRLDFTCPSAVPSPHSYAYRLGGNEGEQATGYTFDGPGTMSGLVASIERPRDLQSFTYATLHPQAEVGSNPDGYSIAQYFPDDTGYWIANESLYGQAGGWEGSPDLGQTDFEWFFFDYSLDDYDPNRGYNGTLDELATASGTDGGGAYLGFAYGCNGRDYYMDSLNVAFDDGLNAYDFEGARSRSYISAAPSHFSDDLTRDITRLNLIYGQDHYLLGDSMGLSDGVLTTDYIDGFARLYGRSYGRSTYKWTGLSDSYTSATYANFHVKPSRQTYYQVRTTAGTFFAASTSKTLLVTVKRRVRLKAADTRIRRGRAMVLTGQIFPKDRGVTVTLQRRVDGRWRSLKSATTTTDGRYRISVLARTVGKKTLRVKAATARGNLGNVSPWVVITVVRNPPPAESPVTVINTIPETHDPGDGLKPHEHLAFASAPDAPSGPAAPPAFDLWHEILAARLDRR